MTDKVTIFKPYPLKEGQKILIDSGPRKGDWQVVSVTGKKVTLSCPVSDVVVEWASFCYFTEEKENQQWPLDD
jgi:hypothetical protein